MLEFYGFRLLLGDEDTNKKEEEEEDGEESTCQVLPADNFPAASEHWVTRFNHNHLRITRIIRSCRVLGLEDEAQTFYGALMAIAGERRGVISRKTLMFWRRAAERPLHLAPEDEDADGGRELDWLVDV